MNQKTTTKRTATPRKGTPTTTETRGATSPPRTDPLPSFHRPDDPRIFVFGSNRLGIHAGGAAAYAAESLGAKRGIGEGVTGRSYALPTCSKPGVPLTIGEVSVHVQRFLGLARLMPEARFLVSPVGCGIAGFSEAAIAPMFADAPENCDLPAGWRPAKDPDEAKPPARPKAPTGAAR